MNEEEEQELEEEEEEEEHVERVVGVVDPLSLKLCKV